MDFYDADKILQSYSLKQLTVKFCVFASIGIFADSISIRIEIARELF